MKYKFLMNHNDHSPEHRLAATPGYRVVHVSDFDQASQFFPRWSGRFEQISRGSFQGKLQFVLGTVARIVLMDANQQLLLRGVDTSGLFAIYPIHAQNATCHWQGKQLTPGQVVLHGVGTHTNHLTSKQASSYGVNLNPQSFIETARILLDTEAVNLPGGWAVASANSTDYSESTRIIMRWVRTVAANPPLINTLEGQQLEKALVRSLVHMLYPDAITQKKLSHSKRLLLAFKAEELMRAHLQGDLASVDFCKELAVSDRTLRLAFHEHYGMGHMAYYKVLRLNHIRTLLKSDVSAKIGEVAQSMGFSHLGNFSADYRRLFGELPSDTSKSHK